MLDVLILFFQVSKNMEAAYGLSICLTMLMTSILIVFYMLNTHIVPRPFVVGYAIVHGTIELAFLGANMTKFSEGGYKFSPSFFTPKTSSKICLEKSVSSYFPGECFLIYPNRLMRVRCFS